jgi:uncharacterized protein YraI
MGGTTRRLIGGALAAAALTTAGVLAAPGAAEAAVVTGVVQVAGTLTLRTGPSTSAAAVGSVRNGTRLQIACYVAGASVTGTVRTTTAWDRLANGRYVSHAYVRGAVPARCATAEAAATGVTGSVRTADGAVNLRAAANRSATVRGTVANGVRLRIACATAGEYVSGSVRATNQWDRLADGRYISHAYVVSGAVPTCADASPPSAALTLTTSQFIAAAGPMAQRSWREFGVPPSVTIAQSILESGWGKSKLAANDRNFFGIKCFTGRHGDIASGCHTYNTTECTKTGSCFGTSASFRTYRGTVDSFRDHGNFLRVNSRYQPAFAYTRNANAFLYRMWKAGYATDPDYVSKVRGIMQSYNLYRYDTWR